MITFPVARATSTAMGVMDKSAPLSSPSASIWSSNVPLPSVNPVILGFSITTSRGSNSNCPASPWGAPTSTKPENPNCSRPDTSTNPPLPRSGPPRAAIAPSKRVPPSAQTMAVPPCPVSTALTSTTVSASTTVVRALNIWTLNIRALNN